MRIPYRKDTDRLHESQIISKQPLKLFKQWFEEALVCPDLYEANAMVLSTVSKEGRPSSRFLLLKGLDESGFHFYTNSSSRKGQDMRENSYVSLLFYWEPLKRQVRIEGKASLLPDTEATAYFNSRPKTSQVAAYVSNQSSAIESEEHLLNKYREAEKAFDNVEKVPKPKEWVGYTVLPDRLEFWQGQTSRLHDRISFFRSPENGDIPQFAKEGEDGWYYERLAP